MKKIITIILAAAMLISAAGCGKKNSDADDYAEKLARGEIEPNANTDENTKSGRDAKEDESEEVELEVPVAELSGLVDTADSQYKSFEILPIDSSDFFVGKDLRLVAMLTDNTAPEHHMTLMYSSDIHAKYTKDTLSLSYPDTENDNKVTEAVNFIYNISEPITTEGGNQFVYALFGDHELSEDNKEFSANCLMLIKMRDDVDMGDGKADTYVLLIEKGYTDNYEIFKVEY